jgi:hypothetical protein
MNRRTFLAGTGAVLLAAPFVAEAQKVTLGLVRLTVMLYQPGCPSCRS